MLPVALTVSDQSGDVCDRCGRALSFGHCHECREARLVRLVWQVVLWRLAPGGLAAYVVGRVLGFCGSPLFEKRVMVMSDMLRGGPWTHSPFYVLDREFGVVLSQGPLTLPVPRRPSVAGVETRGGLSTAGLPGHRGNDLGYFDLSRHIVVFIAPRITASLARCVCKPKQRRAERREWLRCGACTHGALLEICFGATSDVLVPERGDLAGSGRSLDGFSDDRDGDGEWDRLVSRGSPWELW